MPRARKDIIKAVAHELSLVFKDFDGRTFIPVNEEALILGTKAKPVDGTSKAAQFFQALKGWLMSEDTPDDVDHDGDGARDYEDIASHLSRTFADIQAASQIQHEGARSAAVKRVLDDHMDWLDRKRAGADNDKEDEGYKAGFAKGEADAKKAGARHSAADKEQLQALEAAHEKIAKHQAQQNGLIEQAKQHLDALGIHDTHENNDGAQNEKDQKDKERGGKQQKHDNDKPGDRPRSGEKAYEPGPVAEDGYPENYAELAEKAGSEKKKPYGDVAYADPEDGKYPIDSEAHVRAALSYINMPKNYDKLGEKAAAVKKRIVAAAKKLGIEVSDDAEKAIAEALATQDVEHKQQMADLQALVDAEKARVAELETKAAANKTALDRAAEIARKSVTGGAVENTDLGGVKKDPQTGDEVGKPARKALKENPYGGSLTPMQAAIADILVDPANKLS